MVRSSRCRRTNGIMLTVVEDLARPAEGAIGSGSNTRRYFRLWVGGPPGATDYCACRILAIFIQEDIVEQDGYIHSAPELVVEVLSPANTRAERAEKLKDYESLGVPEVWVVSPEAQTVEVLLLQDGRLTTTRLLREGQLKPTRFPEAAVDIAAIWPK